MELRQLLRGFGIHGVFQLEEPTVAKNWQGMVDPVECRRAELDRFPLRHVEDIVQRPFAGQVLTKLDHRPMNTRR